MIKEQHQNLTYLYVGVCVRYHTNNTTDETSNNSLWIRNYKEEKKRLLCRINLLKEGLALAALSEKRPTFPSDRTFFQPNTYRDKRERRGNDQGEGGDSGMYLHIFGFTNITEF
jgi:hypothetical protein